MSEQNNCGISGNCGPANANTSKYVVETRVLPGTKYENYAKEGEPRESARRTEILKTL